jgi:anti-sigma factor RsiW
MVMALSNEAMKPPHADLNALAAFIEQRLPVDERLAVTSHLADCAECRATVATYARAATTSSTSRIPVWMPAAAALILVTTVGLLVWQSESPLVRDAKPPVTRSGADVVLPEPPSPDTPVPMARSAEPPSTQTPQSIPNLSLRRGGQRVVEGKTFRLVAGEWIDTAYDPLAALPIREAVGPDARRSLLTAVPALAKYVDLGPKVLVVYEGTVYRFTP